MASSPPPPHPRSTQQDAHSPAPQSTSKSPTSHPSSTSQPATKPSMSKPTWGTNTTTDPLLRTALRYTISPREYALLHEYLLSRAPRAVRRRVVAPERFEGIVRGEQAGSSEGRSRRGKVHGSAGAGSVGRGEGGGGKGRGAEYNVAAVRDALRVGTVVFAGLKVWGVVEKRVLGRGDGRPRKQPLWKSPNARLSCSLSLILLFHRLLRRFFIRLRQSVLSTDAKPFRRRNPRVARLLTSRLAPVLGSSLSGFFLALCPADQLRITMAIYVFTRALEYGYNYLEELGHFRNRPAWFGSWLLFPLTCGQLLHAFVFDRDCFPAAYGSFILNNSPAYIQKRPAEYPPPPATPWPSTPTIVDGLAQISRLRWPQFTSPMLFPATAETLPRSLAALRPVTSQAHPAIRSLSCALLHPHDPSCLRTYLTYWLRALPKLARFFTLVLAALSLPRYKTFVAAPVPALRGLASSIIRLSIVTCGSIGTSWASICLFQSLILPRNFLATQRYLLAGFLGGLWAFLLKRGQARAQVMYSVRLSVDSLWKVGRKRGWWRGWRGGDVLVFVLGWAVIRGAFEGGKQLGGGREKTVVGGSAVAWALGALDGDVSPGDDTDGSAVTGGGGGGGDGDGGQAPRAPVEGKGQDEKKVEVEAEAEAESEVKV